MQRRMRAQEGEKPSSLPTEIRQFWASKFFGRQKWSSKHTRKWRRRRWRKTFSDNLERGGGVGPGGWVPPPQLIFILMRPWGGGGAGAGVDPPPWRRHFQVGAGQPREKYRYPLPGFPLGSYGSCLERSLQRVGCCWGGGVSGRSGAGGVPPGASGAFGCRRAVGTTQRPQTRPAPRPRGHTSCSNPISVPAPTMNTSSVRPVAQQRDARSSTAGQSPLLTPSPRMVCEVWERRHRQGAEAAFVRRGTAAPLPPTNTTFPRWLEASNLNHFLRTPQTSAKPGKAEHEQDSRQRRV